MSDSSALDYGSIGRGARALSMLLALLAGTLHIAMLWQQALSAATVVEAGRGVVLLLLAMGLMGTARLSLVLVILFCGTSLLTIGAASSALQAVAIIEVALVVLASVALALAKPQEKG